MNRVTLMGRRQLERMGAVFPHSLPVSIDPSPALKARLSRAYATGVLSGAGWNSATVGLLEESLHHIRMRTGTTILTPIMVNSWCLELRWPLAGYTPESRKVFMDVVVDVAKRCRTISLIEGTGHGRSAQMVQEELEEVVKRRSTELEKMERLRVGAIQWTGTRRPNGVDYGYITIPNPVRYSGKKRGTGTAAFAQSLCSPGREKLLQLPQFKESASLVEEFLTELPVKSIVKLY